MRLYGVPMRASSLAITRSAHSAMSLPPPTHQPCTCAITGLGERQMLMNLGIGPRLGAFATMKSLPGSHSPSVVSPSSQWWKPPAKSNPAQNERPAPRSTITFTASSATALCTAASSSSGIGGTIVLSRSGRLSVTVATAPVRRVDERLEGLGAHSEPSIARADAGQLDHRVARGAARGGHVGEAVDQPGEAAQHHGVAGGAQLVGVLLALVAQRVEARRCRCRRAAGR